MCLLRSQAIVLPERAPWGWRQEAMALGLGSFTVLAHASFNFKLLC